MPHYFSRLRSSSNHIWLLASVEVISRRLPCCRSSFCFCYMGKTPWPWIFMLFYFNFFWLRDLVLCFTSTDCGSVMSTLESTIKPNGESLPHHLGESDLQHLFMFNNFWLRAVVCLWPPSTAAFFFFWVFCELHFQFKTSQSHKLYFIKNFLWVMNSDVIIESVKRQSAMALFDGWNLTVMTSGSFHLQWVLVWLYNQIHSRMNTFFE